MLVDDAYADNSYGGISPASITISNVNLVSEGGTNALPVLNVISVDDLILDNSSFDMSASNNFQATMNLKAVSNVSLNGITAAGPGAFIDYAPKSENTMSLSFNDMNISTGSALVLDGATTAKLNFETNPLGTFFTDLPSYDSNGPIDLADKVATGEIDAPLVVNVTYSTTDETSQPVKVTLTANKQVSIKGRLAGWVTTDAGMTFTKEFTTNELETITLVDSKGNSKVLTASVNWIVKPTPPSPTPIPEPTSASSKPKSEPATPTSTIESKSEGELPKTGSSSGEGLSVIGLSFLVVLLGFGIHRKFLKN